MGGVGEEVEADAAKLGHGRKDAVGHLSRSKGCAQFLGEKGGGVNFGVSANPSGGVDELPQVDGAPDGILAAGTILHAGRARAYAAYVRDNPQLDLAHCRTNHSGVKKEGFAWKLFMDWGGGLDYADGEDAESSLTASAQ